MKVVFQQSEITWEQQDKMTQIDLWVLHAFSCDSLNPVMSSNTFNLCYFETNKSSYTENGEVSST